MSRALKGAAIAALILFGPYAPTGGRVLRIGARSEHRRALGQHDRADAAGALSGSQPRRS
jgi:hypothetical protein